MVSTALPMAAVYIQRSGQQGSSKEVLWSNFVAGTSLYELEAAANIARGDLLPSWTIKMARVEYPTLVSEFKNRPRDRNGDYLPVVKFTKLTKLDLSIMRAAAEAHGCDPGYLVIFTEITKTINTDADRTFKWEAEVALSYRFHYTKEVVIPPADVQPCDA